MVTNRNMVQYRTDIDTIILYKIKFTKARLFGQLLRQVRAKSESGQARSEPGQAKETASYNVENQGRCWLWDADTNIC